MLVGGTPDYGAGIASCVCIVLEEEVAAYLAVHILQCISCRGSCISFLGMMYTQLALPIQNLAAVAAIVLLHQCWNPSQFS